MAGRLLTTLEDMARRAIKAALDLDADPDVRESTNARFGDYQINGVLPLAKIAKANPRQLAEKVLAALDTEGMCLEPEIAGPGFINLRLAPAWIAEHLGTASADPRLGVTPVAKPRTVVIDYSSPNVAKRMHVGHLRSTIIGDALARTLRFLGHEVIGDNHIGDWGTQFGILLWAWARHADEEALAADPVGELERLYKLGSEASRGDEAIGEACRAELAALQGGDVERKALWDRFVAISRADAESIYARLNVSFTSWHGESFYHPRLPGVVESLIEAGLARESDGAIAVFFEDIEQLADKPFLVRKRDGAFLYATTDLATIDYRMESYSPDQMIYVVDVRQSLHFRQLFETARRRGVTCAMDHVGFGMMLGNDGRPFRTRDGGTITLASLLDEAEARILPLVQEKWPEESEDTQRTIASEVGIGAVKYADLSPNLATDYRFDWDKLLAADGNTGPYLQYTLVRIRSIFRAHEERFGHAFVPDGAPLVLEMTEEIELAKELLKLGDALDRVDRNLRPHVICDYLYGLSRKYNPFYAKCKVLGAESDAVRHSRLALCAATARALEIGLECLNIPVPGRM
ncbi:MAG: arginine--tRNA ligase [Myxococcota bacterium]